MNIHKPEVPPCLQELNISDRWWKEDSGREDTKTYLYWDVESNAGMEMEGSYFEFKAKTILFFLQSPDECFKNQSPF